MSKPYSKMTPEQKRKSNEAGERWRAAHPEHKDAKKKYHADYYQKHKDDFLQKRREYVKKNKAAVARSLRSNALRVNYGMTLDDYENMKASQGGKCAICQRDKPGGRGDFHVDHDHGTGAVRGLLCVKCNMALGWFEAHNISVLDYLARTARAVA